MTIPPSKDSPAAMVWVASSAEVPEDAGSEPLLEPEDEPPVVALAVVAGDSALSELSEVVVALLEPLVAVASEDEPSVVVAADPLSESSSLLELSSLSELLSEVEVSLLVDDDPVVVAAELLSSSSSSSLEDEVSLLDEDDLVAVVESLSSSSSSSSSLSSESSESSVSSVFQSSVSCPFPLEIKRIPEDSLLDLSLR